MREKTIIDSNAVETTKRELDALMEFFSSAPHVLSDSALVSDPFVLMRRFIDSDWNNMTARLLFTSARKLYRQFGSNSALYFELVSEIYSQVRHLSNQNEVREAIDSWKSQTLWTNPANTLETLEAAGFDPLVCQAIYSADGGLIAVEPRQDTGSDSCLNTITTAEFPIVQARPRTFESIDTLVMLKPLSSNKIATMCASKPHVLLICLGHSAKLTDFVAANSDKLTLVEIYQEYEAEKLYTDLCALTNQISTPNGLIHSPGKLLRAEIHTDTLVLYPKPSRLRQATLQSLLRHHASEPSPLIQATLETRIRRLVGSETQLNYPSLSTGQASSLDAYYTTQLLEASNAIDSGVVASRLVNSIPVSTHCFTQCATLAAADTLALFSPLKITKQYTD